MRIAVYWRTPGPCRAGMRFRGDEQRGPSEKAAGFVIFNDQRHVDRATKWKCACLHLPQHVSMRASRFQEFNTALQQPAKGAKFSLLSRHLRAGRREQRSCHTALSRRGPAPCSKRWAFRILAPSTARSGSVAAISYTRTRPRHARPDPMLHPMCHQSGRAMPPAEAGHGNRGATANPHRSSMIS